MAIAVALLLWFLGGFEMYMQLLGLQKKELPPNAPPWANTFGNVFWSVLWPIAVSILVLKATYWSLTGEWKKKVN
jgi:hypothetical protein